VNNGFSYLVTAELTDVGHRRKNNEDAVLRLPEQGVFCVADGMGGVQGGEVASQAVIDALRQTFSESPDAPYAVTAAAAARLVARSINRASQWIKARSDERGLAGAGSTAVILAFDQVTPSKALILHAGDSRAYCFRADRLVQLSADHSVAAAAGLADDKDLPAMFRGVITRAVGLENTVCLEETPADVQAGDLFLLCSDGLSKMLSDKLLHKLLHKHLDDELQALAKVLIEEALKAGGEDNVSVVLVRVAPSLPQAPTREIPPETRALEASGTGPETRVLNPIPAAEDAPTQETGQTVETADGDAPDKGQRTPSTPASGEGVTPAEGSGRSAAQNRPPTADTAVAPPRRTLNPAVLLALLLLLVLAGLAVVALHPWAPKKTGGQPAAPAAAQPLPLEAPNR